MILCLLLIMKLRILIITTCDTNVMEKVPHESIHLDYTSSRPSYV